LRKGLRRAAGGLRGRPAPPRATGGGRPAIARGSGGVALVSSHPASQPALADPGSIGQGSIGQGAGGELAELEAVAVEPIDTPLGEGFLPAVDPHVGEGAAEVLLSREYQN